VRRGLVFDFDGTIVDSETMWARTFITALAEQGITVAMRDVQRLVGVSGKEFQAEFDAFSSKHLTPDFDYPALKEELRPRLEAAYNALEIMPGVSALLEAARANGWATGLATGTERARVVPNLERLGILSSLDEVVTFEDVSNGKPAPDIYLEVAQRIGVEPANCVALEDSAHGARAALDAGMEVIVCPCEVTSGCEFPERVRRVESLLHYSLGT
jgi:putative hydrolase of the HAD superfamily